MTGATRTPEGRAMFINIQRPRQIRGRSIGPDCSRFCGAETGARE